VFAYLAVASADAVIGNVNVEDDVMFRNAAWGAVLKSATDTANKEGRKAVASLKRRAVNIGRAQGSSAAKFQSTRATNAAFSATVALVGRKAKHYCKSISTLHRLPAMCEAEGKALFSALKTKGKVLVWRNQAQDAATLAASKAAALAGFQSAAGNAYATMHPLAKRVAQQEFNRMWASFAAKWKKQEKANQARMIKNKRLFFKTATQTIIAHAQAAVKKYIGSRLHAQAGRRMHYAARVAAARVSKKVVARTLAPHFIRASSKALPIAVRIAAKKALKSWTPSWSPKSAWRKRFNSGTGRSYPTLPGGRKLRGGKMVPGRKLRGKGKTTLSEGRVQTMPDGSRLWDASTLPKASR
jgi:hypothetical protein